MRDIFTTFQVAKICGVFPTTVINWANKGKLKVQHTPGGHRRIQRGALIEFLKRFRYPIPQTLLSRHRKVFVVEGDPGRRRMLSRVLKNIPRIEIHAFASSLEALVKIGGDMPDLLVLAASLGDASRVEIRRLLRSIPETREIKVLSIVGGALPRGGKKYLERHAEHVSLKPFIASDFRRTAIKLLGSKSGSTMAG